MRFIKLSSILMLFIVLNASCASLNSAELENLQSTNDRLVTQLTRQAGISATLEKKIDLLSITPSSTIGYSKGYSGFASQSWRLEVFEGGEKVVDDETSNKEWDDYVAVHARNLAVPSPYFWEDINVPDNTRFAEVQEHYLDEAKKQNYQLGRSEQGTTVTGENTYILTFIRGSGSIKSRIVTEFWPKSGSYPANILIFYVNP